MQNTTIWKYEVNNFMQLPEGYKILSVQWQHDQLVMWVAVHATEKQVSIEVFQVETGFNFANLDAYKFLGTFQMRNTVFHLFYREL